jgi:cytosine/adenosine deaminase-related metal-dependent hydrolase
VVSLGILGGRVIDPAHGVDAIRDLAIDGDRIVDDGAAGAAERIDAAGLWVIPGLVDLHVHAADGPNARYAHAVLARAGVTTGLELGGPVPAALRTGAEHGAGLTMGTLELLGPVDGTDRSPALPQVRQAFAEARAAGAIGLKVHADEPMSPEALGHAFTASGETGDWLAVHCGSTATASDLTGLRETIAIGDGRPVQVAHVNSYCRGALADPREEAEEALALLAAAPAAVGESYLSPWNGNSGSCRDGRPKVPRVASWLEEAGFAPTEAGLEAAIRAGATAVVAPVDGVLAYRVGEEAVRAWRAAGTRIEIGFPVNPFDSRVRLATARRPDGSFIVPALATDGGAFPRNVTVEAGLALVELGGLSPTDLVTKASLAGARALGLDRKGRLGPGADADVAVVDPVTRRVVLTIAGGAVVMRDGRVTGRGTRVLATPEGTAAVARAGCTPVAYDPSTSGLHRPMPSPVA